MPSAPMMAMASGFESVRAHSIFQWQHAKSRCQSGHHTGVAVGVRT